MCTIIQVCKACSHSCWPNFQIDQLKSQLHLLEGQKESSSEVEALLNQEISALKNSLANGDAALEAEHKQTEQEHAAREAKLKAAEEAMQAETTQCAAAKARVEELEAAIGSLEAEKATMQVAFCSSFEPLDWRDWSFVPGHDAVSSCCLDM